MLDREIATIINGGFRRKASLELNELARDYRLCAEAEGKSKSYISLVTACTRYLENYLAARKLATNVNEIDTDHIRGFILYLQSAPAFANHPFAKPQDHGLSGHAVNTYMRSLRAFWSWLEAEGLISNNPFYRIKIPKPPVKLIPNMSPEETRLLLAQANILTPLGFRNYTVMSLLLDTMMRVSELAGCQMPDLNMESRELRVWGKGSKQRLVPFGKIAQKSLWRYIRFYRPEPFLPREDRLFLTDEGRPLTKNRVEAFIGDYARKAGIRGIRVSPHTLRHTGAVAFLRNGGDVYTLQRIMGHSSLEVLRGYINLSQADLNRVHAGASPLDNLGLGALKTGKSSRR